MKTPKEALLEAEREIVEMLEQRKKSLSAAAERAEAGGDARAASELGELHNENHDAIIGVRKIIKRLLERVELDAQMEAAHQSMDRHRDALKKLSDS